MIGMTFDSEIDTGKQVHDLLVSQAVVPGVWSAGSVVRRAAREELKNNRSRQTGTRERWSESTRAEEQKRPTLIRSIVVSVKADTTAKNVTGLIGPSPAADQIGNFMEFGHEAIYWGRKSTQARAVQPPEPFLRPAFVNTKSRQLAAMAATMRRRLRGEH